MAKSTFFLYMSKKSSTFAPDFDASHNDVHDDRTLITYNNTLQKEVIKHPRVDNYARHIDI